MHHIFSSVRGQVVSPRAHGPRCVIARAVVIATAIAFGGAGAARGDELVRARGHELVVGGAPFRFVGANLAVMHGAENRAAAGSLLIEAARDGIRVARIWALGEGAADAPAWLRDSFLFRAGPRGWVDAAPRQLDAVVAAAGKAGVRLIIALSNNWSDYGGVPQYLRWSGRWRPQIYGGADRFYSDPRARDAYRAHVERLLGRTNALTGVAYRDDPTIMAWELMNESQVATAAGARARRAWIVEMARLVHRLDPNHLVMSGVSTYRGERERKEWLSLCRLPEVDVCDGHVYPEETLSARAADAVGGALDATLDDFVQLAAFVAGKPFVLGEFGVRGDAAGLWRGETRAAWIARVFDRLRTDGAAGGMVWIYQPTDGSARGGAPAHDIGVRDPRAAAIRQAMREAAAVVDRPAGAPNPLLGADKGDAPLLALRADLEGEHAVVPTAAPLRTPAGPVLRVAWDPPTYQRVSWEATGVYAGGAVEHVWGGETGYYEYGYTIAEGDADGVADGDTDLRARSLVVRARVSSEYPGTLSPPDGASRFAVSLDGVPVAAATAVRDDGLGRWITLRSSAPALLRAAARPGQHRLRFTVPPGPQAHGLCLYGRLGEKPAPTAGATGPITLTLALGRTPAVEQTVPLTTRR